MLERNKYMTDTEIRILEEDMKSQVSLLKEELMKKENFIKKDRKISIMKEGDEDADESV